MWWRPTKDWDNSQKPLRGNKDNPIGVEKITPKDKDKDKDKEKDNEKECEEKHNVVITLDAKASRWTIEEKGEIGKKDKHKVDDETLRSKLLSYWLNEDVVELAIIYNGCKKGKKLSKFDDKQLGIWVKKLKRCWFETNEGMKQVIENSIAGNYEWIFELKQPIKPIPKYENEWDIPKVIEKWWYYFYNA